MWMRLMLTAEQRFDGGRMCFGYVVFFVCVQTFGIGSGSGVHYSKRYDDIHVQSAQ